KPPPEIRSEAQLGLRPIGNRLLGSIYGSATAAASDGQDFIVLWEGSGDILGARIARSGALQGPFVLVSNQQNHQANPRACFDGQRYFVSWTDHRYARSRTFGVAVSTTGMPLASSAMSSASITNMYWSKPAGGSGQVLATWGENRTGTPSIFARRLDDAGTVGGDIEISQNAAAGARPTGVATDGTDFLVLWQDARPTAGVYFNRILANGAPANGSGVLLGVADGGATPVASYGTGSYLVAWEQGAFASRDVLAARVSSTGVTLDTMALPVGAAAGRQANPAVAFAAPMFLVVWENGAAGAVDIYGARVAADGTLLDPDGGFPIATFPGDQVAPVVSFEGNHFVVGWRDRRDGGADAYVARVSTAGALLDPQGMQVTSEGIDGTLVDLASDGTGGIFVTYARTVGTTPLSSRRALARLLTPELLDGGAVINAGDPDAGQDDAGEIDAGDPIPEVPPTERVSLGVGCGCGSAGSVLPLTLLALALAGSRRRKH
ncbi:MAG: hypothetical protein ACT4TC_23125, partial [Myxococcaceae bacterium]